MPREYETVMSFRFASVHAGLGFSRARERINLEWPK